MTLLQTLHIVAAFVVLAEGLNKLERADLFAGRRGAAKLAALRWLLTPWRWRRERAVDVLGAAGWALGCIGAGGALAAPLLRLDPPSIHEFCVMAGCALLIVRRRAIEDGAS